MEESEANPPTISSKKVDKISTTIDLEFQRSVEEREIKFIARKHAIRDCAIATFVAFVFYITIGILCYSFWFHDWSVGESLLFIICKSRFL